MAHVELKWGFDFDGVLCGPVPSMPDAWRIPKSKRTPEIEEARNLHCLEHFKSAKRLLRLPALIHKPSVITARQETPLCRQISTEWLSNYVGSFDKLIMHKGSQHFEAVASYKAKAIKSLGINCYVDDKMDLCQRIKEKLRCVCVFYFNGKNGFSVGADGGIVALDVAMNMSSHRYRWINL